MIEIVTTTPDASGFKDFQEVAPNVFYSKASNEVVISDSTQALLVKVTQSA